MPELIYSSDGDKNMKKWMVFMFLAMVVSGYADPAMKDDGIYAVFETDSGKFICKFYEDKAPVTVANFVGLAEGKIEFTKPGTNEKVKKNFYDGLTFHRIIDGFMIQGGDPMGSGMGGPGYKFIDEFDSSLRFDGEGLLAMANSGPETNGSQFFITLVPTPHLNDKHTIFGKVVSGMDVVKKIALTKVDNNARPYKDVYMNKVSIVRVGDKAKAFDPVKEFAKQDEFLKKKEVEKEVKMNEFLKSIGVDITKIITTKTGLKYFIKKEGTGEIPKKGQKIVAHYAGYLYNGKKFDSSYDRNEPFETEIGVGRVIKGWDDAFLEMKEGEKRVLILPYNLAYGERGYPPVIPAKATLIFDVELIKVKK
jgi:peptidyl-prolyl cis-trans isomerase A (cyclophilin A)